ncbi:MAG TPA: glycosyltransferase family 2 protein [Intrasporangium sp.]|nr:glycosyltransferase family 2 protein [Intrasporangium sp.]
MSGGVDVLVPSCDRPPALAVTLSGLAAQTFTDFRVVISDQSVEPVDTDPLVAGVDRVLELHGTPVTVDHHLPRRGVAENRHHLLELSDAPYVLFLDDDVWLEPWALSRLVEAIDELGCGFVGFAVQGLSYVGDRRPHQLTSYEEWPGRVEPERVRRDSPAWDRHLLHNAANPTHLAEQLRLDPSTWRAYKVAWIGACVLYRRAALVEAGGFSFWRDLPREHAGEDVVPQLRVMERHGGAGILPSGAVHLELPTTVPRRDVECYDVVGL